jgi:choice-of-anchor C domain-containing protein
MLPMSSFWTRAGVRPRAVLGLIFLLAGSPAAANLLVNESFEAGPSPGNYVELSNGSTALTGWVVTTGTVDYVEVGWNAADGMRSLSLNGSGPGAVAQTFFTNPGAQYTVTFFMAGDAFGNPVLKHMRVAAAGQFQDYEFDASHAWPWDLGWLQKTFTFTANSGSTTLTFTSLDSGNQGPALDKVVVTGPAASSVPDDAFAEFLLGPPHPNPASAGCWLEFDLPRELRVRVSISDIQGREIRVLEDAGLPAGRHSLFWDGSMHRGIAPAGIYFIRLESAAGTFSRKIVLSR